MKYSILWPAAPLGNFRTEARLSFAQKQHQGWQIRSSVAEPTNVGGFDDVPTTGPRIIPAATSKS